MENDLGVAGGWVSVVGCNDMFVAREAMPVVVLLPCTEVDIMCDSALTFQNLTFT